MHLSIDSLCTRPFGHGKDASMHTTHSTSMEMIAHRHIHMHLYSKRTPLPPPPPHQTVFCINSRTCIPYVHQPALSASLTSAPWLMREVAVFKSPLIQAMCSGVSPRSFFLVTRLRGVESITPMGGVSSPPAVCTISSYTLYDLCVGIDNTVECSWSHQGDIHN